MSLRVLHLIDSLGHGGAEVSLVSMLDEYRRRDVESTIACLVKRETEVRRAAIHKAAAVIDVPGTSRTAKLAHIRRLIRDLQPHVIHTVLYEATVLGRVACLGMRKPVLTSLVSTTDLPMQSAETGVALGKLRIARGIERLSGRLTRIQRYHANSIAASESAMHHLHIRCEDITVIPRGRDPVHYAPISPERRAAIRRGLGIEEDALVFLNVGRQQPAKGQRYLIQAFVSVIGAHPRARLVVVGPEGASTAQLEELIRRNGLEQAAHLLGRRDDVPDLMKASDVFVLPSLWEGLPNAVIEAMASSLPVVASDIAPVREVVEADSTALLATPQDPSSLSEQMRRLAANRDERDRLGARGKQVFLENFTIGPVADRMVSLYEQLAGVE